MREKTLRKQVRNWIVFFIIGIVLSGVTAFPLVTELTFLESHKDFFPPLLSDWISQVSTGIIETGNRYPFILYGTDWLAFAHCIIAMLFIGPLRDPVKNKWVIDWAILCCFLIFPLAFIAGPIRNIPFFHLLIDCSFGVIGMIPLWIARKKIRELEVIELSAVHHI